MKRAVSYYITEECRDLLTLLAKKHGMSRGGLIELLVREAAGADPTLARTLFEYQSMKDAVRTLVAQTQ